MYNENDVMFEAKDLDECIEERKELIEEAKHLEELEDTNEINRKIKYLNKRWKKIQNFESAYEEELRNEFDSYVEKFYVDLRVQKENNENAKNALIKKAKELLNSAEKNVSVQMNELMNEWKTIGSAGREKDEELWQSFNEARQTFFDKRHQDWEELQAKFKDAKEAKLHLIEEVKAIVNDEDILKTNEKMNELFEQWKATPRASREEDDELWKEFNDARQVFYERRNKFYDELHAEQAKNLEKKKALIDEARAVLDSNDFSRENTNVMKELGVKWKEAGACGRHKDDQVWKEFRSIMDAYFDGLKANGEKRHQLWVERMNDAKNRKNDLILKQKRQLERLEREMGETLSESMINDYKAQIEDKKNFIAELEKDIEDIEARLTNE